MVVDVHLLSPFCCYCCCSSSLLVLLWLVLLLSFFAEIAAVAVVVVGAVEVFMFRPQFAPLLLQAAPQRSQIRKVAFQCPRPGNCFYKTQVQ